MSGRIEAIILAGGAGKRMRSRVTKVLMPLAGRRLLDYPLLACRKLGTAGEIVVVGVDTQAAIGSHVSDCHPTATVCVQAQPRGTGDAVAAALPSLTADFALILYGDAPLIRAQELALLVSRRDATGAELVVLTAELDEPFGYGRILRDAAGRVVTIREEKDLASDEERKIREVNAGSYLVESQLLRDAVSALTPNNAQGELYLTDIVAYAAADGRRVEAVCADADALRGVNDRQQLAEAELHLRERIRRRHRAAGVSVDSTACIDDTVELEPDVEVRANVQLRGDTRIAAGTVVDVGCVLSSVVVGPDVRLLPYSVATSSVIEQQAQVGPFAHVREGSHLGPETRVGNFVETKNTTLQRAAKAGHLSYLGDGDVGQGANIGAGTIFCNYDGYSKHRTVVGAGAFVGSDSQLVAPVTVGRGAIVAAGSTITADVPDDALVVTRGRQVNKLEYAPLVRQRAQAKQHSKP